MNPNHLFLGSHDDNMKHKVKTNIQIKGESHYAAILTESDIKEIRHLANAGYSHTSLGKRFNTCRQNIDDIVNYKTWKHV